MFAHAFFPSAFFAGTYFPPTAGAPPSAAGSSQLSSSAAGLSRRRRVTFGPDTAYPFYAETDSELKFPGSSLDKQITVEDENALHVIMVAVIKGILK